MHQLGLGGEPVRLGVDQGAIHVPQHGGRPGAALTARRGHGCRRSRRTSLRGTDAALALMANAGARRSVGRGPILEERRGARPAGTPGDRREEPRGGRNRIRRELPSRRRLRGLERRGRSRQRRGASAARPARAGAGGRPGPRGLLRLPVQPAEFDHRRERRPRARVAGGDRCGVRSDGGAAASTCCWAPSRRAAGRPSRPR